MCAHRHGGVLSTILALRRLRQEDCKSEDCLCYIVRHSPLTPPKKERKNTYVKRVKIIFEK
jgi:hypothetical protein